MLQCDYRKLYMISSGLMYIIHTDFMRYEILYEQILIDERYIYIVQILLVLFYVPHQEAIFSIISVKKPNITLSIIQGSDRNHQHECGELHCGKSIDLFSTCCCHLFSSKKNDKEIVDEQVFNCHHILVNYNSYLSTLLLAEHKTLLCFKCCWL